MNLVKKSKLMTQENVMIGVCDIRFHNSVDRRNFFSTTDNHMSKRIFEQFNIDSKQFYKLATGIDYVPNCDGPTYIPLEFKERAATILLMFDEGYVRR